MKHNIEVNGVTQEMEFNLGSGILDCNDREIFEGHPEQTYVAIDGRNDVHL